MCGRVGIPATGDILESFDLAYNGPPTNKNINVAPTNQVPVIDNQKPKELQYKNWSLVPLVLQDREGRLQTADLQRTLRSSAGS